jgi:hypothetical protein
LTRPKPEDEVAGWNGEANWNRDGLERIVALLFALANLADLAAGASFIRRRQVLEILGYGEAEARAFVIGMVSGEPVSADALEPTADAVRLATSFRALALALCILLARGFALPGAFGRQACRPPHNISGPAVRWPDASVSPAPDTS